MYGLFWCFQSLIVTPGEVLGKFRRTDERVIPALTGANLEQALPAFKAKPTVLHYTWQCPLEHATHGKQGETSAGRQLWHGTVAK